MFEDNFQNPGQKLKEKALFKFAVIFIAFLLVGIVILVYNIALFFVSFIIVVIGYFFAYNSTLKDYALGELVENSTLLVERFCDEQETYEQKSPSVLLREYDEEIGILKSKAPPKMFYCEECGLQIVRYPCRRCGHSSKAEG